jgi:hypothetical protein
MKPSIRQIHVINQMFINQSQLYPQNFQWPFERKFLKAAAGVEQAANSAMRLQEVAQRQLMQVVAGPLRTLT